MVEEIKGDGGKMGVKKMFGLGLLVIVVVAVGILWALEVNAVRRKSQNPLVVKTAALFNIPAIKTDSGNIAYSDYMRDFQTLKKFYLSQQAESRPTDEQISDQAASRLILNEIVKKLAKQYDATVGLEDIDKVKNQVVGQFGSEAAMLTEIKNRFGWTFDQYIEFVVKPVLLEQKVAEKFASSTDEGGKKFEVPEVRASHILFSSTESDDAKVKAKAEGVLKRIKSGEDFAKLAGEFGSDSTKSTGGDLGWFGKGQMVKEFEDAVFALESGQLGENLVKTQFGYHIVKVTEKRMVRDFKAFLDEQLKTMSMKFLVPIHNPFESLQK